MIKLLLNCPASSLLAFCSPKKLNLFSISTFNHCVLCLPFKLAPSLHLSVSLDHLKKSFPYHSFVFISTLIITCNYLIYIFHYVSSSLET